MKIFDKKENVLIETENTVIFSLSYLSVDGRHACFFVYKINRSKTKAKHKKIEKKIENENAWPRNENRPNCFEVRRQNLQCKASFNIYNNNNWLDINSYFTYIYYDRFLSTEFRLFVWIQN